MSEPYASESDQVRRDKIKKLVQVLKDAQEGMPHDGPDGREEMLARAIYDQFHLPSRKKEVEAVQRLIRERDEARAANVEYLRQIRQLQDGGAWPQ